MSPSFEVMAPVIVTSIAHRGGLLQREAAHRKAMPAVLRAQRFFWLGILGVAGRRLGDSSVPRQLALPHQQGYSALSFLV
jgi:hypothetical protein